MLINRLKKTACTTMALITVLTTVGTTTANADTINAFTDSKNTNKENLSLELLINSSDNGNSKTTLRGANPPMQGFIKGKSVKRSKYQNYAQAGVAAAFIASLTGIPVSKVAGTYGNLMLGLQALGKSDVYYIRTEYVSKTGELYYYQYKYYSDSGYNHYIGTSYSHIYSKWA